MTCSHSQIPANAGNNTFTSDAASLTRLIDGGAGFDSLLLTSAAFNGAATNLKGIERIEFDGSGTLSVSAANLIANGVSAIAITSAADFDPMRAVSLGSGAGLKPWHSGHVTAAELQGDTRFTAILAADHANGQPDDYQAYSVPAGGGHGEIILLVNTAIPVMIA